MTSGIKKILFDTSDIGDEDAERFYDEMSDYLIELIDGNEGGLVLLSPCERKPNTSASGKYIKTWDELRSDIGACDDVRITREGKKLYMDQFNRDGSMSMEIRRVTKKGLARLKNLDSEDSREYQAHVLGCSDGYTKCMFDSATRE